VLLANIIAIKEVPVIWPSIDQLSVGDCIEYKHIFTKGEVEVWRGIVVVLSTEMELRHRPTPDSVVSSPQVDESSSDSSGSASSKHEHPRCPSPEIHEQDKDHSSTETEIPSQPAVLERRHETSLQIETECREAGIAGVSVTPGSHHQQ